MSSSSGIPQSLHKTLGHFMREAAALQRHDPLMAYYCKLQAMNVGIPFVHSSDEAKTFLLGLMSQLETEKQQLEAAGHNLTDPTYAFNWANKVFTMADEEDRAGKASKKTARTFVAAATFIDTLAQFGALPEALVERRKYAKFKAADILRCLKEGVRPQPGPPLTDEERELEKMMEEDRQEQQQQQEQPEQHEQPEHQSSSFSIPTYPSADLFSNPSAGSAVDDTMSDSSMHSAVTSPPPPPPYNPTADVAAYSSSSSASSASEQALKRNLEHQENQIRQLQETIIQMDKKLKEQAAAASTSTSTSTSTASSQQTLHGFTAHPNVTPESILFAHKHARFIASALQYDDVSTALKEIQIVLNALCQNKIK